MLLMSVWKKLVHWVTGGVPHNHPKWLGHKIATIGVLVAFAGATTYFIDLLRPIREIGYYAAFIGWAIVVVGIIVSWFTFNNK